MVLQVECSDLEEMFRCCNVFQCACSAWTSLIAAVLSFLSPGFTVSRKVLSVNAVRRLKKQRRNERVANEWKQIACDIM